MEVMNIMNEGRAPPMPQAARSWLEKGASFDI
jgi:hypothetical protein